MSKRQRRCTGNSPSLRKREKTRHQLGGGGSNHTRGGTSLFGREKGNGNLAKKPVSEGMGRKGRPAKYGHGRRKKKKKRTNPNAR